MTIEITPRAGEIAQQAGAWLKDAQSLTITAPLEYERSAGLLQLVKRARNDLERERVGQTKPLDEQKAQIMASYRPALGMLDNAEDVIKRGMLAFDKAVRERARLEAAKAHEQAERERDRLLGRAQAAAEKGNIEQATVLEDRAVAVQPKEVEGAAAPKMAGISTRETWRYEIVNGAVIPREYLMVDEKKIGAVVRALQGATRIPGVRVYPETVLAAREAQP